jgi:hypothetical protein
LETQDRSQSRIDLLHPLAYQASLWESFLSVEKSSLIGYEYGEGMVLRTNKGGSVLKLLAINGSPRKTWNTAALLEESMKGAASQGAATEMIHLYD